jgi:hypothetical protein
MSEDLSVELRDQYREENSENIKRPMRYPLGPVHRISRTVIVLLVLRIRDCLIGYRTAVQRCKYVAESSKISYRSRGDFLGLSSFRFPHP